MSTTSPSSKPEESEEGMEPNPWDDDGDGNLMALFVLDEFPIKVRISSVLPHGNGARNAMHDS